MAITVEDGTGKADADALISVAFADTYHADRGNTAWAAIASTELKEQAIRRASTYLDEAYTFEGLPVNGRDQAFQFPMSFLVDRRGYSVPSNVVPDEVQRATAEAALREAATPGSLSPDYTPNKERKSAKVGPIAVEYANTGQGAQGARPRVTAISDVLRNLMPRGGGSRLSGDALRS